MRPFFPIELKICDLVFCWYLVIMQVYTVELCGCLQNLGFIRTGDYNSVINCEILYVAIHV